MSVSCKEVGNRRHVWNLLLTRCLCWLIIPVVFHQDTIHAGRNILPLKCSSEQEQFSQVPPDFCTNLWKTSKLFANSGASQVEAKCYDGWNLYQVSLYTSNRMFNWVQISVRWQFSDEWIKKRNRYRNVYRVIASVGYFFIVRRGPSPDLKWSLAVGFQRWTSTWAASNLLS